MTNQINSKRDQNIYWHIRRSETIPSIDESIRNNTDCFEINFISGEAVDPEKRKSQHLGGKRAIDSFDYEDASVYSTNFPSSEFAHICGNSYFTTASNKKGGNTNFDKKVIFPKCKSLRGWIKFGNHSDERFTKIVEWSSLPNPKIAKKEYQRSKNNTADLQEWFKTYIYKILKDDIEYVKNNISGTSQKVNLKLRNPQQNAVNKMSKYFIKDPEEKKEFLLGAIQRFGKNVTWLSVIQQLYEKGSLKHKNIAVLTYRPWVFSSLKEDIEKFSQFKDFNYINIAFDKDLTTLQKNKINIIISSVQLLLSDTKTDKADLTNEETKFILNKLDKLSKTKLDFVIVDEYHFGCTRTHNNETSNFGKILNCLDYHNKIWISGTPFYDLCNGTFPSDQKFIYDQLDEYNDIKELCKDNKYAICKLKLVYYSSKALTDVYTRYKAELEKEDLPLIDKVFNNKNKLIAKEILSKIFDYNNIENHINSAYSIFDENFFKINENGKIINTVMCNCGRITRANLISLLLDEIFGNNIHIIKWYGRYNIDIEDLISKVKYYNRKNEPCIILSCGKGFEGISVPGIHAVLHFCTSHSAIQYFQFGYRGKTPDIENEKEYCYIIDFDFNRMLEMYHELAVYYCNKNNSDITTVTEELLKAMPFICRNETTKIYSEINLNDFWEKYKHNIENRNYKDYLQQDVDINTFINFAKNDEYINDILEAIKIATKGKAKITKQQLTYTPELAGGKKSKRIKTVALEFDEKKKNPHEEDKPDTKIEKYFNELIQFILQNYLDYCEKEAIISGETNHFNCKNHLIDDIKNKGQDYFYGINYNIIEKILEFFNSTKIEEKLLTFKK